MEEQENEREKPENKKQEKHALFFQWPREKRMRYTHRVNHW